MKFRRQSAQERVDFEAAAKSAAETAAHAEATAADLKTKAQTAADGLAEMQRSIAYLELSASESGDRTELDAVRARLTGAANLAERLAREAAQASEHAVAARAVANDAADVAVWEGCRRLAEERKSVRGSLLAHLDALVELVARHLELTEHLRTASPWARLRPQRRLTPAGWEVPRDDVKESRERILSLVDGAMRKLSITNEQYELSEIDKSRRFAELTEAEFERMASTPNARPVALTYEGFERKSPAPAAALKLYGDDDAA